MGDGLAVFRQRQHHHAIAQIAAARIAPGETRLADPDLAFEAADVVVLDGDDIRRRAYLIDEVAGTRRLAVDDSLAEQAVTEARRREPRRIDHIDQENVGQQLRAECRRVDLVARGIAALRRDQGFPGAEKLAPKRLSPGLDLAPGGRIDVDPTDARTAGTRSRIALVEGCTRHGLLSCGAAAPTAPSSLAFDG